jgi:hypothetical protein
LTAADVTIYVWYNAGGGLTQPAANASFGSQAVWDSSYSMVLHFPNGTTLIFPSPDSTSFGNNGLAVGTVTAVTGKIDGAINNVTAGGNGMGISVHGGLQIASKITISAWINIISHNPNGGMIVQKRHDTSASVGFNYGLWLKPTGELDFTFNDGAYHDNYSNTVVSLNTWHHLCASVDETAATKIRFYLDGAADGTPAYSGAMVSSGTEGVHVTNYYPFNGGIYQINGSLDELRISTINRSANWVTTEYHNQNSPTTFVIAGTPSGGGGGSAQPQMVVIC